LPIATVGGFENNLYPAAMKNICTLLYISLSNLASWYRSPLKGFQTTETSLTTILKIPLKPFFPPSCLKMILPSVLRYEVFDLQVYKNKRKCLKIGTKARTYIALAQSIIQRSHASHFLHTRFHYARATTGAKEALNLLSWV
jgi:hypothetical protein